MAPNKKKAQPKGNKKATTSTKTPNKKRDPSSHESSSDSDIIDVTPRAPRQAKLAAAAEITKTGSAIASRKRKERKIARQAAADAAAAAARNMRAGTITLSSDDEPNAPKKARTSSTGGPITSTPTIPKKKRGVSTKRPAVDQSDSEDSSDEDARKTQTGARVKKGAGNAPASEKKKRGPPRKRAAVEDSDNDDSSDDKAQSSTAARTPKGQGVRKDGKRGVSSASAKSTPKTQKNVKKGGVRGISSVRKSESESDDDDQEEEEEVEDVTLSDDEEPEKDKKVLKKGVASKTPTDQSVTRSGALIRSSVPAKSTPKSQTTNKKGGVRGISSVRKSESASDDDDQEEEEVEEVTLSDDKDPEKDKKVPKKGVASSKTPKDQGVKKDGKHGVSSASAKATPKSQTNVKKGGARGISSVRKSESESDDDDQEEEEKEEVTLSDDEEHEELEKDKKAPEQGNAPKEPKGQSVTRTGAKATAKSQAEGDVRGVSSVQKDESESDDGDQEEEDVAEAASSDDDKDQEPEEDTVPKRETAAEATQSLKDVKKEGARGTSSIRKSKSGSDDDEQAEDVDGERKDEKKEEVKAVTEGGGKAPETRTVPVAKQSEVSVIEAVSRILKERGEEAAGKGESEPEDDDQEEDADDEAVSDEKMDEKKEEDKTASEQGNGEEKPNGQDLNKSEVRDVSVAEAASKTLNDGVCGISSAGKNESGAKDDVQEKDAVEKAVSDEKMDEEKEDDKKAPKPEEAPQNVTVPVANGDHNGLDVEMTSETPKDSSSTVKSNETNVVKPSASPAVAADAARQETPTAEEEHGSNSVIEIMEEPVVPPNAGKNSSERVESSEELVDDSSDDEHDPYPRRRPNDNVFDDDRTTFPERNHPKTLNANSEVAKFVASMDLEPVHQRIKRRNIASVREIINKERFEELPQGIQDILTLQEMMDFRDGTRMTKMQFDECWFHESTIQRTAKFVVNHLRPEKWDNEKEEFKQIVAMLMLNHFDCSFVKKRELMPHAGRRKLPDSAAEIAQCYHLIVLRNNGKCHPIAGEIKQYGEHIVNDYIPRPHWKTRFWIKQLERDLLENPTASQEEIENLFEKYSKFVPYMVADAMKGICLVANVKSHRLRNEAANTA